MVIVGRAGDRRARARHDRGRPARRCRSSPTTSASARSTASTKAAASPSARGLRTCCASTSATRITLVSPRGAQTPFGTAPRIKPYVITALFEMGMSEYDRTMVFMPLLEAQRYFSRGAEVDVLEVVVDDPEQVDDLQRGDPRRPPGPAITSPTGASATRRSSPCSQVERNVMFIILSLIVLVAALNIISGLMMLVKDKGRDIAILRTMGATRGRDHARLPHHRRLDRRRRHARRPRARRRVLPGISNRSASSSRWLTGTTLFDPNVYYLTRLPADMDVRETAVDRRAWRWSLSVLATLYPSWRASPLDPVEALRYE